MKNFTGVALVMKYVCNKDVFMRFYKAHLTRRLILQTSADNEMEEEVLNLFRNAGMPAGWINSLHQMFKDIGLSKDLNDQFKAKKGESGNTFYCKCNKHQCPMCWSMGSQ